MKNILLFLFLLITLYSTAQVGIGTRIPEPSAMFEVKSNSKGVLISRMTESERSSIKTPVAGLLVYQTDRSAGFYYHTGIEWKYLPPEAISQPLNSSTTTNGVLASTATATTYIFNSPLVENLGAVSLPKATSVASGYLSSADWNTFNNKVSIANAQAALNTKLTANSAIIGGTKTKITYDSKGLVTAGANATTNDITEGTNLYFTEQRVRNTPLTGYTVGTNTAVANTDNLMASIGKLEARINALNIKIDSLSVINNLTSGLVAYYPFTGNADDSSAKGNHGKVNGAALSVDRFGILNSAYYFDGINNNIEVSNSSTFDLGGNNFSISVWVKCQSEISVWGCKFISKGGNGLAIGTSDNGSSGLPNSNINYGVGFDTYGKNYGIYPDILPKVGWNHIVCIKSNSGYDYYVNNHKYTLPYNQNNISKSDINNVLYFGKDPLLSKQFNGYLDEIRIYNRSLTQSEITYLATH